MATKQELELKILDLENDVRRLSEVLTEVYVLAESVSFDKDTPLETCPAYLLGRIGSCARLAFMRCFTFVGESWIEKLDRALAEKNAA